MIIDFHTHTFPDEIAGRAVRGLRKASRTQPFSDGTVEGLRHCASQAGIDISVILPVATSESSVVHINDAALRLNEAEAKLTETAEERMCRLLSFGCMHPEFGNFREEMARIKAAGLPGIKLHPYFSKTTMDDIRYLRILDRAAEIGLIVVTHGGYDIGFPKEHFCTVPMLRHVMRQIGPFPLVAAHMGGWQEWEQVPELLADTGIYLDTSFSTGTITPDEGQEAYWGAETGRENTGGKETERAGAERAEAEKEETGRAGVERAEAERKKGPWKKDLLDEGSFIEIVRAFPEGHVLFGTDSPWGDAKKDIAFIQNTSLSETVKSSILGGAAEHLLQKT